MSNSTTEVKALASFGSDGVMKPFNYKYKSLGDEEIQISVTNCGLCHSDLHAVRNEWKSANYPLVPGHEIVGIVTHVGKNVTDFKVGDRAGIGCFVQTCGQCEYCKRSDEQYCAKGVFTYNGKDDHGDFTYGGFSNIKRSHQKLALKIPTQMSSADAAPLFCAGITVYSPLKFFTKPGERVGIIGIGGLGHLGIQYAKALGRKTVAISSSNSKKELAFKLGADEYITPADFEKHQSSFDFLLFCGAGGDIDSKNYLNLLKVDGKLCLVGIQETPMVIDPFILTMKRLTACGSLIGSIKEIAEMLDLSVKHNIKPMIEELPMSELNTALTRMSNNDVKFRFVLSQNL